MEAASFLFEEEQQEDESFAQTPSQESNSPSEYSLKQLEMMMNEAVQKEDYEKAAQLKKEIEERRKLEN